MATELSPFQQILQHDFEDAAFTNYHNLVDRVNLLTESLTQRHRRHLCCRAGCSMCCHNVIHISPVEAFLLKKRLLEISTEHLAAIAQNMAENNGCPLLINELCSLYDQRPIICRTHGLPHIMEFEDDDPIIHYCELNFTELKNGATFGKGETVDQNNLDTALAAVNLVFLRDYATDFNIPRDTRIPIAEICVAVIRQRSLTAQPLIIPDAENLCLT